MDILDAIFEFFRRNPLLAILVIAGIAQSIGSAAASKKREADRRRRERSPEIRFDPPHDTADARSEPPTPVVQEPRNQADDLARRIRDMLEESRSAERRPAPPPVPPVLDSGPGFEEEREETRSLLGDLDAGPHEVDHLHEALLSGTGGTSLGSLSDSSLWGRGPALESMTLLMSSASRAAKLPGGIDPRLAVFASVVLGPPRAFRSWQDECPV